MEEIQYMGTKLAKEAARLNPVANQRPVNATALLIREALAVVLHIEAPEGDSSSRLTFRRLDGAVVPIGRKPPSEDSEKRLKDNEAGKAMFRCPVVSRKHAKLSFSDSGVVYITDLSSHHGTHLRKPSETISKMLAPELATPLADGDILTFGKSVGKNDGLVRPVVARVELIQAIPAVVPATTMKPVIVADDEPRASPKSGRYGIFMPSSGSSDGSSDHIDSDIEELPSPPSAKSSLPSLGRSALDAFKKFIPPPFPARNYSESFASLPPLPPILPSMVSNPIPVWGYDFDDNRSVRSMDFSPSPRSHSPSPAASGSAMMADVIDCTPAPPIDPIVVGAWPHSRSSSVGLLLDQGSPLGSLDMRESQSSSQFSFRFDEGQPQSPGNRSEYSPFRSRSSSPVPAEQPKSVEPIPAPPVQVEEEVQASTTSDAEMKELRLTVDELKAEVLKLNQSRRKYRYRFNNNMQTLLGKLGDLRDDVSDSTSTWTALGERVDDITNWDLPELQSRLDALEDRLGELESEDKSNKASLKTLNQTLSSIQSRETDKDNGVDVGLAAIADARESALAAIAAAQAVLSQVCVGEGSAVEERETDPDPVQTPVPVSLKRKRSDEQDEDEVTEPSMDIGIETGQGSANSGTWEQQRSNMKTSELTTSGIDVPAPKRARRLAKVVAQTATAVTIGAVVTWSALAFA
ncbi:hypothetical protein C8J56DRAFT_1088499 [Mycena floridula]|nr:hypothetical protein C8J56DRAFT_1088499 [Mycena floridula]